MPLSQPAIPVRSLIEKYQRSTEFLQLTDRLMKIPETVTGLVDLAVSDDVYPFPQYASQLLLHVARKDKTSIDYHKVVDCLLVTNNSSVQRNLLGVILCFPLNDYKDGELLDWLFVLINDPASKPGLLNYAVRKLAQFVALYPELLHEIEQALELREQMNLNPGILAWSKKVFLKRSGR